MSKILISGICGFVGGTLASETRIPVYGKSFILPMYINRRGALAGAGQFGCADRVSLCIGQAVARADVP